MMNAEITRIAAKSDGKLTFGFLLGLGIALLVGAAAVTTVLSGLSYLARCARILVESRRAW